MKITDKMVVAFLRTLTLDPMRAEEIRTGLEAVAPLIAAQHQRELLTHARNGPARGSILDAIDLWEAAQEPPSSGHR